MEVAPATRSPMGKFITNRVLSAAAHNFPAENGKLSDITI